MLCSSEHHNPPANFDPVWRDNGGHAVFHLNEKLGRGEPERKKKEKKKKKIKEILLKYSSLHL